MTILFAVDTMLHHQNTKMLYWFMLVVSRALLDNILACSSLIKNSALECQHLNTQKLKAQITISQQFG